MTLVNGPPTLPTLVLTGGVSRQPASQRFVNQVEDAEDVLFSLVNGPTKRPGSAHIKAIDRLFTLATATWTASSNTLTQVGAFASYTLTSGDVVFISSGTGAALGVYGIATRVSDDAITLSQSLSEVDLATGDIGSGLTADRSYRVHTIERDENERYIVVYGLNTLRVFSIDGTEAVVTWSTRANNTQGKITLAGADWTEATRTLTEVGAFTGYSFTAGDTIDIISGTDVIVGSYQIQSRTSNDAVVLHTSPSNTQVDLTNTDILNNVGRPTSQYFAGTEAADFSLITDADNTIIMNRTTATGVIGGTGYVINSNKDDYEALVIVVHSDNTFHTTKNGTGIRTQGVWYFGGAGPEYIDANGFTQTADSEGYTRCPDSNKTSGATSPPKAGALIDARKSPIRLVRQSTSPLQFEVDLVPWKFRETGDDDTNKAAKIWAEGLKIADGSFHKNRLLFGGDQWVVMSQAEDVFNMYVEDDENVVDSDPIESRLTSKSVSLVDSMVPFRESIVVFTKAEQQFELGSEVLKPGATAFTPTTNLHSIIGVKPTSMANQVYFPTATQETGVISEYVFDDIAATNIANDITKHVFKYLPPDIDSIHSSPTNGVVVVFTDDDPSFFVYKAHRSNNDLVQSAWGRYNQAPGERIASGGVIRDNIYILVEMSSGYVLDRLSVPIEVPEIKSGTWYGDPIEGVEHTDYTAFSDGEFTTDIDGVTADVTAIDTTAATNKADVATAIQTRLQVAFTGSPLCRFQGERLVITSGTTGANSKIGGEFDVNGVELVAVRPVTAGAGTDFATAALMGTPGVSHSPVMPYNPHTDRKIQLTGSYSSVTNETTWDYGLDDPNLSTLVLGRDFGPLTGARLSTTRVNNQSIKTDGDFSQGDAIVGRNFSSTLKLSRVYPREPNGNAIVGGALSLIELVVTHKDTGFYKIQIEQPGRVIRTSEFITARAGVLIVGQLPIEASGSFAATVLGDSKDTVITLINDIALPCSFPALEFSGDFERRIT